MPLTERQRRELSDLASQAADGILADADRPRLEEILRASPDARAYYVRFMNLSAGLAWTARDQPDFAALAGALPSRRDQQNGWLTAAAAAAAIAFALVGLWSFSRRVPVAAGTSPAGIATLSTAMNVEWVDAREPEHVGNLLQPGWVRLKSGLAQIDFLNGASVWLEGPVELRLDSTRAAFCSSGKVVAQVPRASSDFRLTSPRLAIEDKGAGFGMEVNKDAHDSLHVFRGTLEVTLQTTNTKTSVQSGQALSVDQAGTCSYTVADPNTFSREEFAGHYGPWGGWDGGPGGGGWSGGYSGYGGYGSYGGWGGGGGGWSGGYGGDFPHAGGPPTGMGPPFGYASFGSPPKGPPPVMYPGQWKGADPMDPVRDALGATPARWIALKKPLEDFLAEQRKSLGLDFNPDDKGVAAALLNLHFAVDDESTTNEELTKRMAAVRTARTKSRQTLLEKESTLRSLLTEVEQAKLVTAGFIP